MPGSMVRDPFQIQLDVPSPSQTVQDVDHFGSRWFDASVWPRMIWPTELQRKA